MSHTPHHNRRRTGSHPEAAPAPINVWPAWLAALPSRNPRLAGSLSAAVAARLVCTYTRPGDLVVALDHQLAVAEAADWFARKATLLVADSHRREAVEARVQPLLTPTRRACVRVIAADVRRRVEVLEGSPERAAMIIARLPEGSAASDGRRSVDASPDRLLDACATALRPGGHLAVEVPSVDGAGRFADHATAVIATAKTSGLVYLQHLVVINDRLSEVEAPPRQHPRSKPHSSAPASRQHIDIYVFTKIGTGNV